MMIFGDEGLGQIKVRGGHEGIGALRIRSPRGLLSCEHTVRGWLPISQEKASE